MKKSCSKGRRFAGEKIPKEGDLKGESRKEGDLKGESRKEGDSIKKIRREEI